MLQNNLLHELLLQTHLEFTSKATWKQLYYVRARLQWKRKLFYSKDMNLKIKTYQKKNLTSQKF